MADDAERVRAALDRALTAASGLSDRDAATIALACHYADALDAGADTTRIGPALLAVLDALLLTPRARAAVRTTLQATPDDQQPRSPLDELRARRAARG